MEKILNTLYKKAWFFVQIKCNYHLCGFTGSLVQHLQNFCEHVSESSSHFWVVTQTTKCLQRKLHWLINKNSSMTNLTKGHGSRLRVWQPLHFFNILCIASLHIDSLMASMNNLHQDNGSTIHYTKQFPDFLNKVVPFASYLEFITERHHYYFSLHD